MRVSLRHSEVWRVELTLEPVWELFVLHITFYGDCEMEEARWEALIKRCKRRLGRYDISHAAYYIEEALLPVFSQKNLAFAARKQELISKRYEVFARLAVGECGLSGRRGILFVVESGGWSCREVELLMSAAKDYFEDIYICVKTPLLDTERLCRYLYDVWGVAVHLCSPDATGWHAVCLLISGWQSWCNGIVYQSGYMVSEREADRKMARAGGRLYSGMEYQMEGQSLPYQMAVDLLYQNREKYQKIDSTIVDIYELK